MEQRFRKLLEWLRPWVRPLLWNWKRQWFYLLCQCATTCALLWWILHKTLPWPGTGVAIIAFLAAVMSVHRNLRGVDKVIYFTLMSLLLLVEFRAMRKDREEAQNQQRLINEEQDRRLAALLSTERENTGKLIDQENKGFDAMLKQNQVEFANTLTALMDTHRQDEKQFANVIRQENNLIESQREISERFSGRLVPGDTPTPANSCDRRVSPTSTTLLFGNNNAQIVDGQMPTIQIGLTTILGFEKRPNSQEVYVSVDFRDAKNRILMRLNKNGTVSRTADLILLHPDKSTLLVEDVFGEEFFRVVYLNPHAFKISGKIVYCGKPMDLFRGMSDTCTANKGGIIGTDPFPCPTQP